MDDGPRLSRAQLAALDRLARDRYGLPTVVLMENAGRGAAGEANELLGDPGARAEPPHVVVLAGPGNNGGDAWVLARHLANAGVEVEVLSAVPPERLSGDAALMANVALRMGLPVRDVSDEAGLRAARPSLERADLLVDGLLGTGFRGELRPAIARLVEASNEAHERGVRVLALDLPSGLDADTGEAATPTVVADVTVTFAARKPGFDQPAARRHLGRVVVATIGAPQGLVDAVGAIDAPTRPAEAVPRGRP